MRERLKARIAAKTARIVIVGMGYVGLPLALRFAENGFPVVGLDVDPEKIARLGGGRSYIGHIPDARIQAARAAGFEPSTDHALAREADAVILCVPTPLTRHREPDLSYIDGTLESLLPHLRPGQLLSLESTTYPGTTEEHLRPKLEGRGFRVGEDFFLVYSPEREDPGNTEFEARAIPKVCSGCTPACLELGAALYGEVVDRVVPVSSPRAAEMTKLLENIHRAVNIGLVNEMKVVADRMGIDIHEVIQAAATKPFGFTPYYPGPGLGGHCIPIDPFYLTWKAREYGIHTRFIELAGEVNSSMPGFVVSKVTDALNEREQAVRGSRVLVLGLAYKKNVDDVRESPSVVIMEKLRDLGAEVAYHDPHVPVFPRMRDHHFDLASVALTPASLASYDCVIVATAHDCFDYAMILEHARLIVDTRGVYRDRAAHVVRA